jgi:recombination protein RecR
MASLPEPILQLAAALGHLPGIGPRSAERLALHLAQAAPDEARRLAETILEAREKIQHCQTCGALTEKQPCAICDDPRRDSALVCVVETPVDVIRMEKSGTFKGRFHVLGGRLSPVHGVEPEDLRIAALETRLASEGIKEIVLAIGSDVEGDATSHYLARRLGAKGVKVTRLAQGLPAGSGLEFADEITLSRALENRREFT